MADDYFTVHLVVHGGCNEMLGARMSPAATLDSILAERHKTHQFTSISN